MTCALCLEVVIDMLDHVRVMHPDVLDQRTEKEVLSLSPVTQEMNDDDQVCENCDKQFCLGQLFGEQFEGIYHGYPVVSLVCGECFMAVS